MHDLEISGACFENDPFRYHIHHNPLSDNCGVEDDAVHFFFNYRTFTIIERLAFNDTIRVFQPPNINLILFDN